MELEIWMAADRRVRTVRAVVGHVAEPEEIICKVDLRLLVRRLVSALYLLADDHPPRAIRIFPRYPGPPLDAHLRFGLRLVWIGRLFFDHLARPALVDQLLSHG